MIVSQLHPDSPVQTQPAASVLPSPTDESIEHDFNALQYVRLISDEAYEAGVARLRAAARTETGPVIDALDLVVLS